MPELSAAYRFQKTCYGYTRVQYDFVRHAEHQKKHIKNSSMWPKRSDLLKNIILFGVNAAVLHVHCSPCDSLSDLLKQWQLW